MRILLGLMALAASARACGAENPPASADLALAATNATIQVNAPLAKHGGTIIVADDVQLELVVKGSGEIVAYPVEVGGAYALPSNANVDVTLPVAGSAPKNVRLRWNARTHGFEGRAANVEFSEPPRDVQVRVRHEGRVRVAQAPQVIVVQPAAPRIVVAATPPTTLVVEHHAPGASLVVAPPSVDVRVQRPGFSLVVDDHHGHRHHGKHKHKHRGHRHGHGMRH